MKLNKFEFFLMNNFGRRLVQRFIEIKNFRKFSNLESGKAVLEIGCGSGYGTKLIKKYFQPKEIFATDLDEKMIKIARQKNKDNSINFSVADATNLNFPHKSFDAVFDFGVIHHIPNWKEAILELKRVLKPSGELILEELSVESFSGLLGRVFKKLFFHPYEQMFSKSEFVNFIKAQEFEVLNLKNFSKLGVRYFVVVAKKLA